MKKLAIYLSLLLVTLTGCFDPKLSQDAIESDFIARLKPPTVEVHAPPPVDEDKLRERIERGLNERIEQTQTVSENRQQGLLNVAVTKMTDKITGVEATVNTKVDSKITGVESKINANIETTIKNEAKLEATSNVVANMTTKVEANATATANAELKIKELEVKGQAAANGQIGWNNKFQQEMHDIRMSAGRDVNYFPREVVYVILSVVAVMLFMIWLVGRNAAERMRLDYAQNMSTQQLRLEEEREERQASNQILLEVLSMLPSSEHDKVATKVARLFKRKDEV